VSPLWLATALPMATPLAAEDSNPATVRRVDASPSTTSTFDMVYETHFDFVWKNLRRLGVDMGSVDDAAHDVFLVVHRQLEQFVGHNYRSWLFAIAQRVAWHYRRALARRRTDPLVEEDLRAESTSRPDECHEKHEATVLVHQLLEQLSSDRRAVFVLSELERMSMPEIAEMLGIPLNTAYSRLRLARRDFSRMLQRQEQKTRSVP
jgi:RNA polymerase sigma-70 factor, ECF subfamily